MKLFISLLHLGFMLILNCAFAEIQDADTGTLIVTYKTDSKGERLNRIRFWLIDSKGSKVSLYPKTRAFVEDPKEPSRMVVIEKVRSGDYTLKFLVPNADRYFTDVLPREIHITQGDVVKVDQQIKPAGVPQAAASIESFEKNSLPIQKSEPSNLLISGLASVDHAFISTERQKEVRQINRKHENTCEEAIKECSEDLSDYRERELPLKEAIRENNAPLASPFPSSISREGFGKLIISYDYKLTSQREKDNIRLRLIDSKGNTTIHPIPGKDTEVQLIQGKMMVIPQVSPETYRLEFFIEGTNEDLLLARNNVRIEAGGAKSLHEILENTSQSDTPKRALPQKMHRQNSAKLALTASANIPTAIFRLESLDSNYSLEGDGRVYTFENLKSGTYLLHFDSFDPFFVPPPSETITLTNQNEIIESNYQTLSKIKVHTNIKDGIVDIMRMDTFDALPSIEIKEGTGIGYYPPGDYQAVFKARERGKISPDPVYLKTESLQTKEISAYFIESARN